MRTIVLLPLMLATASAALAADPAPQGTPAPHHWDRAKFEQMRARMEARRADDIALLLGLRADQRPALDAFLASMHPMHREGGMGGVGGGATPPAPPSGDETFLARLDKMSARMDRMDAAAKQHLQAARAFYTSLTPDQQRRFDALERLRGGMRHGMGGRMHQGMKGGPGHMGHGPEGAPPAPPQG